MKRSPSNGTSSIANGTVHEASKALASPGKGNVLPATAALRRQPTSGGLLGLFGASQSQPKSAPKPMSVPAQGGLMNNLLDKIFGF